MKRFLITDAQYSAEQGEKLEGVDIMKPVEFIGQDNMQVSDGYHTMDELYEHRIALFIALCEVYSGLDIVSARVKGKKFFDVWRSKFHSDGGNYEGWFVLGIGKEKGKQITYHLPMKEWETTNFAETLDKAPEYDGHTSKDVLERLRTL